MASDTIRVLVPTGREAESAPHKDAARGREAQSAFAIGLLDNHKHNTDKILDRLERRLGSHYKDVQFVRVKKSEAGKAAPRGVIEELAGQCQAVVNGIGD